MAVRPVRVVRSPSGRVPQIYEYVQTYGATPPLALA